MNYDEIKILEKKNFDSGMFTFVFLLIVTVFLTLWYRYDPSVFIFPIGIVIFLILIYSYVYNLIRTKKDRKEKVKIIDKLKITNIDISRGNNRKTNFKIIFDSDKVKSYNVNVKHYGRLAVGDFVDVEYTKHAHWILSIKRNEISLENPFHIA